MNEHDFERRLRASLHRHAQDAPDGYGLSERIVAASDRPHRTRQRLAQLRSWTLPLAAAAVVAVIAGALVGVSHVHHSATPAAATHHPSSGPSRVPSAAPSATLTNATRPSTSSRPDVPAHLKNIHVLDATFVGPDDGWLLANATCLNGKPGQCTAMLRTTDGGAHWTGVHPPPVNVPGVNACKRRCVQHIRFANARTGYAFGPGAFFMTTDGGKTWQRQPGGAAALETLSGNVIRLRPVINGCTLGCRYSIETSAIGPSTWTPRERVFAYNLQLARGGADAYVLAMPHLAGNAPSTLYRSSDNGATWHTVHQPCRTVGGYHGFAVAAGGGGRVSLLCSKPGTSDAFVAVSSDHGSQLRATRGTIPHTIPPPPAALAGDPRTVLLASSMTSPQHHRPYRSADGGRSWHAVPGITGPVTWAGFESKTDGRIIANHGRTIWSTHDAGAHWKPFTFR